MSKGPLALLIHHPELVELNKELNQLYERYKEQMEFLERRSVEEKRKIWDKIQAYGEKAGFIEKVKDPQLSIDEDAIYEIKGSHPLEDLIKNLQK